jgi:hypothetical protein
MTAPLLRQNLGKVSALKVPVDRNGNLFRGLVSLANFNMVNENFKHIFAQVLHIDILRKQLKPMISDLNSGLDIIDPFLAGYDQAFKPHFLFLETIRHCKEVFGAYDSSCPVDVQLSDRKVTFINFSLIPFLLG